MNELGIGAMVTTKGLETDASGVTRFVYYISGNRFEVPAIECAYCMGTGQVDCDVPRPDFINGGWLDGGTTACNECEGYGYKPDDD